MCTHQSNSYLTLPLPASHAALIRLQKRMLEWLAPVTAPLGLVSRVHRAAMNATIAIEVAGRGSRPYHHVKRAHESMLRCLSLFGQLCLHSRISQWMLNE